MNFYGTPDETSWKKSVCEHNTKSALTVKTSMTYVTC